MAAKFEILSLYSHYKHSTTAKILTASIPSGCAVFFSDIFEGSISDRQILIESGFLDYIEKGQSWVQFRNL